jgi:hypothetical protein
MKKSVLIEHNLIIAGTVKVLGYLITRLQEGEKKLKWFEHEHPKLKNKFHHLPKSSSKDCQTWQAFSSNNFLIETVPLQASKQGKKEIS